MAAVDFNIRHHFPHDKMYLVLAAILLFVGLMLPLPALAAAPAQINLLTKAMIEDDTIRLGRIAEIRTEDAHVMDTLAAVEVGQAPLPGNSTYIHPSQVERGLKKSNIDVSTVTISAIGPVKVTRSHSSISPERIKEAVIDYIKGYAPWDADQLKIRPINYTQSLIVPPGHVVLQVFAPKHTDWLGGVPFTVKIMVDGQLIKKTSVATYIEVWQNVILAAKPLGHNQPITKRDIKIERMNLTRVPKNAIFRADQVIGRRANRSIAINSVLRVDQIDMPPLVHRGDMVQALAESKLMRISANAIAKEDGKLGERIRLVNVRSKKTLYGQVIDSQTVKVEF